MLVSGLIPLDLSALLQLVLTALALLSGALLLVRKAASRYFFVDASFDSDEPYNVPMSIGGGDDAAEAAPVPGECAVCRDPAPKKCSRCKSVRYCSSECQLKHWECHKLNCKQAMLSDKADKVSSDNGLFQRRKLPGFNPISLVPARGKCKILREPKRLLFPYEEFVKLFNWDKPGFLPCGLINCGNSCFVNVVLQCLASTRPLVAYLMKMDHSRGCSRKVNDWCFLCELQIHIQKASESLHPFSPINILSRLPNIGGNLGCGNQEDAHELMRFAIDTMQSVCLDEFGGEKAVDFSTQETTLIQYIFGGHLQSQVICTKCNMISNRYENMMDLTVEIQGDAASLQECLDQFTIKERLDGENMYKCDGCNDYVKAWKQLTVHQPPNILTIALKRFQSGRFGKLNKRITFPESLDLAPYMSNAKGDGADLYNLYAVVVHVDTLNASFFGHYICYTKDYHGRWYRIDDNKVVIVEVEDVLSQGAYMLLYSRRHARREPFVKPVEPTEKKHVLEIAPETSLCRDTGHDRSISIGSSYAIEERERVHRPIPVAKEYEDVDMDDSEPIASKLKDIEGKSDISRAEDSSIQVEAMDCVVLPEKYIPEHSVLLENSSPSMVETSSSVSAIAASLVPDPLDDASPSLKQVLLVPGPSVSSNGAKTTEEHTGEDAEEDVLINHISKVNGYINGHVGNDACLDSPSLNSESNTPSGSGMSLIAKGNCNGFAGHDSLGSHSGNGKGYMTPGFLNKSYSKPMRVNRN